MFHSNKDTQSPVNYFIHGTTSKELPLLAKTDFKLLETKTLIAEYQLAPLTGEINKGGYRRPKDHGLVRFGRVQDDEQAYPLKKIIEDYCVPRPNIDINNSLTTMKNCFFSTINQFLIYYMREQQYGNNTELDFLDLEKCFKQTILFLKIFSLLGRHIFFKDDLFSRGYPSIGRLSMFAVLREKLTYENILMRIDALDDNYDFDENNPSTEDLNLILSIFELPQQIVCMSSIPPTQRTVTTPVSQILTTTPNESNPEDLSQTEKQYVKDHFINISKRLPEWGPNRLFSDILTNELPANGLKYFSDLCRNNIIELKQRWALLEKSYHHPTKILFSEDEINLINNNFPIIFACENETFFKKKGQEYCAIKPLQIGCDIRIIATDNEEHRLILNKFFSEKNIKNVEVILFKELTHEPLSISEKVTRQVYKGFQFFRNSLDHLNSTKDNKDVIKHDIVLR